MKVSYEGWLHQSLAKGKGCTVRWVLRKPDANLRPEEHEAQVRLGQSGELANNNEAPCNQGLVEYMRQVRRESQRSYLGRPVIVLHSNPAREGRLR